ncbi:MAG: NUDIX domain-containing protein, partial [Gelidibacter sp.]
LSTDKKTVFHKRTTKGIWQNLYQFPLLETEQKLKMADFKKHAFIQSLFKDAPFEFSLYNSKDIVHKLSHQHLHTKFWIVEVDNLPQKGIPIAEIKTYPTPILISKFIDEFFV